MRPAGKGSLPLAGLLLLAALPCLAQTPDPTPPQYRAPLLPSATPGPGALSVPSPTPAPLTPLPAGTLLAPVATPTSSPSPTFTPTPTFTSSPTPTPTPGVFRFIVSPRPDAEGRIRFQRGTNIPVDEVFLKIYSTGFRIIYGFDFTKDFRPEFLVSGDHSVDWDGRDDQGQRIPPGTYLCFLDIRAGKERFEDSGKFELP